MARKDSGVDFRNADLDKFVNNQDTNMLKTNLLNGSISVAINNEYKSSRSRSFAELPNKKAPIKKEKIQLCFGSEDDDSKSSISINMPASEDDNTLGQKDTLNYSRYRDSFAIGVNSPTNKDTTKSLVPDQLNDLSLSCIQGVNFTNEVGKVSSKALPVKSKFRKFTNIFKGK
jgi:hypothetical protein